MNPPQPDPAAISDAFDALKLSKITLMMQKNTVFYTTILFSLKQEIGYEVPTAATDGKSLLINPVFFNDLTPNERLGLLAHEVLHVALDHMHRKGPRDPKLWNIAADYVINGHLTAANYVLPKNGLYDKKYDGMTTEAVYDVLYKKNEQEIAKIMAQCANGALNGQDVAYPENAPDGQQVTQDEVTTIILRASTQAKMSGQPPGSLPGEIEVELKKTLNPPLPWYVILRNYLTDFAKDDYSFRRPNKRFLPHHYLPMAHSESIPNLAVAVDASGSVNDHEFNTFITQISILQEIMKPKKITVISFDTNIKSVQELTQDANPFRELKFKGRGGTNIAPVHKWAAENKPTMLLVFTDGDFHKVKPDNPHIPLIWLIHDNSKWECDHGRTIHYTIGH